MSELRKQIEKTLKEYGLHSVVNEILGLVTGYEKTHVIIPRKQLPHKIVCLVGSTRSEWQQQYRKVNRELCLKGYVVVTVSLFKTDVQDIEKYRDLLESIHFQKIHLSDVVVLIHKNAIGTHTAMELEYCEKIGKPTVTFNDIEQTHREIELLGKEKP